MKKKLFVFFFMSGASALIFEIVWMRMLSLVFGVTTYAMSIILISFMGGLGLGSLIWGRIIEAQRNNGIKSQSLNPLNLYSRLQLGIGVFGLSFPFLINLTKKFYVYIFSVSSILNYNNFIFLQVIVCILILIIPTSLMGGTLPVIYKYFELSEDDARYNVSFLYAYETFGALLGAFLAGFFLIEKFGVLFTNNFAGCINLLIGFSVLFFIRKNPVIFSDKISIKIPNPETITNSSKIWFLIFALSGFCALSYEIIWTKILVLIINSTTYSFSLILMIFLSGIASGSAFGNKIIAHKKPEILLGYSEIFIGIYTLFILLIINYFAEMFFYLNIDKTFFGNSWFLFNLAQFILLFILLFPISFCFGITFPSIINLIPQKNSLSIGKIYAFNTFGGVIGSFITGFFLIQILGIKNTFLFFVIINILIGIITICQNKQFNYKYLISAGLLFIIFIILISQKDVTFKYLITRGDVNIIYHNEDASGIIEVYEYPQSKERILVTDRHQREGGTNPIYLKNQYIQGYLPIILHPDPKKVLGLGLGTGISFSVMQKFDLEKIDVVEISNGVISALKYFEPENNFIKNNVKIKIHKADARNFVLLTKEKYDVIIGELFVPYQAGVGNLYAYEHFSECKKKLSSNGMMWQWIPTAQISPIDLNVLINTFSKVFPHTSLWITSQSFALLGTKIPLQIDFQRLAQICDSDIGNELKKIEIATPQRILSYFQLGDNEIKKIITTSQINNDYNPFIEFNAPKYFYAYLTSKFFIENNEMLLSCQGNVIPYITNYNSSSSLNQPENGLSNEMDIEFKIKKYILQAQIYLSEKKIVNALEEYAKVYNLDPKNIEAKLFLEDIYIEIGHKLYKKNKIEEAKKAYKKALEYNPGSKKVYYYLEGIERYKK
ncbi:fused MFS/spermidine synthase [Candidatus Desantisbacteria bacterium]|nr:fused MFS/spermidine synthase [Candidatus Desantisbacteria bacterium]